MIAKAKSISHGINDIRYITGESRNKKHPERIYHVKDNLRPVWTPRGYGIPCG
jgi:hypothetical protein